MFQWQQLFSLKSTQSERNATLPHPWMGDEKPRSSESHTSDGLPEDMNKVERANVTIPGTTDNATNLVNAVEAAGRDTNCNDCSVLVTNLAPQKAVFGLKTPMQSCACGVYDERWNDESWVILWSKVCWKAALRKVLSKSQHLKESPQWVDSGTELHPHRPYSVPLGL